MKVPGVYVEIRGDLSQLKADMSSARKIVTEQSQGMAKALEGAFSPAQVSKGIRGIIEDMNKLSTVAKIKPETFKSLSVDLGEFRRVTGMSEQALASLQSRLLETSAAKAQERALRSVASSAGFTRDEIKSFGAQMGVSAESINKVAVALHGVDTAATGATKPITTLYDNLKSGAIASASSSMERFASDLVAVSGRATSTATAILSMREQLSSLGGGRTSLSAAQIDGLAARVASNSTGAAQEKSLQSIAEAAGLAEGEMRQLGAQMGVSQLRIQAVAAAMYKIKMPIGEAVEEAKSFASMLDKIKASSVSSASSGFSKLAADINALSTSTSSFAAKLAPLEGEFHEVAMAAGLADQEIVALKSRFSRTTNENAQVQALKSIQQSCGLTKAEMSSLGQRLGLTKDQMARLSQEAGSSAKSLSLFASAGQVALGVLGAQTALEMAFRVKEFGADVLDAGMNVESLAMSFNAIFDSAEAAADQMARVRAIGQQYGQNFYVIADGYKQMTAAAKGSNLEGEITEKLFRGVSAAGTVLGMTNEKVALSIKAFTDMISKGQIQMEEVKNQLGDNLPGAVRLFARSLGVGTDELLRMAKEGKLFADDVLPKVAEELQRSYGKAAETAALETGRAAVNRLSQEYTDLKANLYDSDLAVGGINAITAALKRMNNELSGGDGSIRGIRQDMFDTGEKVADAAFSGRPYLEENQYRGKVGRSSIESRSFLGNWSEIEAKTSQMSVGQSQMVADAQKKITDEITRGRTALAGYIQTDRERAKAAYDNATKYAQTEDERSRALAAYKDALEAIDKREKPGSKTSDSKAASLANASAEALAKLNEELAKTTGNEYEAAIVKINERYRDFAKTLGAGHPLLQQWHKQMMQNAKLESIAAEQNRPENVATFERMNRGDMFYGMAEANERANKMIEASTQRDEQLLVDFSEKFRETVLGETEFKLEQIEEQAEAYRKAGADEVAVAMWAAQEKKRIATDWQSGLSRGLEDYANDALDKAKTMEDGVTSAFKSMEDAIVDFAETGKFSFSDFASSVVKDMMRIAVQQSITGPLASGLNSIIGSFFNTGGVSYNPDTNLSGSASSIAFSGVSSAKGNVFDSGLSSWSNSIVSSPTYFDASGFRKFATGGVFGEAGPEAVMPLTRTSDGKLGVASTGGSSVSVEVNNYSGQQVQTREVQDARGGRKVQVTIGDMVAGEMARHGSAVNKSVRNGFGLRPALVGR